MTGPNAPGVGLNSSSSGVGNIIIIAGDAAIPDGVTHDVTGTTIPEPDNGGGAPPEFDDGGNDAEAEEWAATGQNQTWDAATGNRSEGTQSWVAGWTANWRSQEPIETTGRTWTTGWTGPRQWRRDPPPYPYSAER